MSYTVYKLLHLLAVISLFLAIGALLSYSRSGGSRKHKKNIMILHGLAALVLFISGFGLIARLKLHSFPLWLNLKIGLWLILSVLIPLLISRTSNKKWIYLLVLASGFSAVYLALFKL